MTNGELAVFLQAEITEHQRQNNYADMADANYNANLAYIDAYRLVQAFIEGKPTWRRGAQPVQAEPRNLTEEEASYLDTAVRIGNVHEVEEALTAPPAEGWATMMYTMDELPSVQAEVAPTESGVSGGSLNGSCRQEASCESDTGGESYPGQAYFHEHNPRIKRAELALQAEVGNAAKAVGAGEGRNWKGVLWRDSIKMRNLAEEIGLHFAHDCNDSMCGEDADASNCEVAWIEDKLSDFLDEQALAVRPDVAGGGLEGLAHDIAMRIKRAALAENVDKRGPAPSETAQKDFQG